MEKTAFLYAGQGSQYTGMGKDFYNSYPEFKSVFDQCKCGFDIKKICFENSDNLLQQTEYTQPCMVAFACGVTEILIRRGLYPDYVCGLSLGEYSALYAANVWSLADTLDIISYRGKVMAEASEGIDAGMIAITGTTIKNVEEACRKVSAIGIATICNINCPGQIVIGGDNNAVKLAAKYLKDLGAKRCVPLLVSGPFHTPYMKPAADKLKQKLKEIKSMKPTCEVLFNYLGRPKENEEIIDLLVNQIQYTVRMEECIQYLLNNDVRCFIEIGPGNVLSGFLKKCIRVNGLSENDYQIIGINNSCDVEKLITIRGF